MPKPRLKARLLKARLKARGGATTGKKGVRTGATTGRKGVMSGKTTGKKGVSSGKTTGVTSPKRSLPVMSRAGPHRITRMCFR